MKPEDDDRSRELSELDAEILKEFPEGSLFHAMYSSPSGERKAFEETELLADEWCTAHKTLVTKLSNVLGCRLESPIELMGWDLHRKCLGLVSEDFGDAGIKHIEDSERVIAHVSAALDSHLSLLSEMKERVDSIEVWNWFPKEAKDPWTRLKYFLSAEAQFVTTARAALDGPTPLGVEPGHDRVEMFITSIWLIREGMGRFRATLRRSGDR